MIFTNSLNRYNYFVSNNCSFLEALPTDVAFIILKKVSVSEKDLLNCSLSSKGLRRLALRTKAFSLTLKWKTHSRRPLDALKAHCMLTRLGMSTFEKVATLAKQCGGWHIVAMEHTLEGRHDLAIEACEQLLPQERSQGTLFPIFQVMASQKVQTEEANNAIDSLKRIIRLSPDSLNIHAKTISYQAEAHILLDIFTRVLGSPEWRRVRTILTWIEKQIANNEFKQAALTLEHFESSLINGTELDLYFLIDVYVQMGFLERAWDLVNRNLQIEHLSLVFQNALARKLKD